MARLSAIVLCRACELGIACGAVWLAVALSRWLEI
jgi:hypothetical protein